MKKSICIFCAMVILCTQILANGIYIPDDVADTEYENVYGVLSGISVFDADDVSSFRPLTPITRGDFTIALGNIMKALSSDGNVYFYDVPKGHKAFDSVNKLIGYGVISGFDNGMFRPDEGIRAVDAVKMLMLCMGYYNESEDNGGYPDGYMKTANRIGLLKGVRLESNGELLRGEAAKMLYNSLELPAMRAKKSGNKYGLEIGDVDNFLYTAMGIKKIKGTVNANNTYSIDGDPIAPKDCLRIDSTVYYCPESEWTDMPGYSVICYYEKDEYDRNRILYLSKNTYKTTEIMISAKDADSFSFPEFSYKNENGSKLKKLTVSDELCMIYNGKTKQGIAAADFCPPSGELHFIDNDDDGKYDIVKIKTYTNALVSAVTEDSIYICYPVNDRIELSEYDSFSIYNIEGNRVSISDLKENDVISIYESIDKQLVNIVYSRRQINGEVIESYEDDGLIKLLIDDVLYDVSFDYDKSFPTLTSIGTRGTFCLDANGDIYTMAGARSSTRNYGYLIRTWADIDGETYCIRLLEETGKVVDRTLSKKVKLDGDGGVKAGDAYVSILGAVQSPVVYKTNQTGEVTMIDTVSYAQYNDDDRLKQVRTNVSGMYRSRTMSFNFVLPIDSNTKFFIIPDDPDSADYNEYGCGDYRFLENEVTYNNMDYYRASDKLTADIVVMKDNSSLTSVIGVVTDIKTAVNTRDEIAVCYTLQTGSGEASYTASKESVGIEIHKVKYGSNYSKTELIDPTKTLRVGVGDIVMLYTNGAGEFEKSCIIYDKDAEVVYSDNPNTEDANVTSFQRYLFGEISEIDNGIAAIARSSTNTEYYNLKGKTIYIYTDAKRKGARIRRGMTGDLNPGDKILIVSTGGIPQYAFAY